VTAVVRTEPLYDRLAGVYDRWLSGDEAAAACQDFYRGQLAGERSSVLELGCGTGRICRALAGDGVPITGLDLSMSMLRAGATAGARLVRGDFTRLPFADAAFAAVLLPMRTVGHLTADDQVAAAFAEVTRVLRPGGRFGRQMRQRTLDLLERSPDRDAEHPLTTLQQIDDLLGRAALVHRCAVRDQGDAGQIFHAA